MQGQWATPPTEHFLTENTQKPANPDPSTRPVPDLFNWQQNPLASLLWSDRRDFYTYYQSFQQLLGQKKPRAEVPASSSAEKPQELSQMPFKAPIQPTKEQKQQLSGAKRVLVPRDEQGRFVKQ